MIDRVTKGPPRTRAKLNELIDAANRQGRAVGDEFIHRKQAGSGSVAGFAPDVLQPHIPRRRVVGASPPRVFGVQSPAVGDGVYNCYEQVLDATDWDNAAGTPKFEDLNETSVEVLNLAEFDPNSVYIPHLIAGDLILAYRVRDDEGNTRWEGTPFRKSAHGGGIRRAWVKTTPGATDEVTCNIDHSSGRQITVSCEICGGSALNAAVPRLTAGDAIFVTNILGTWYCTTVFQTVEVCDCYEE